MAALWVVLFHATAAGDIGHNFLFDLGDNGVAIFFALSGFVIAHSIRGQEITSGYIGRFALRRSIRLDPALWASIGLFLAFAFFSAKAKHEPFAAPSLGELAANITYSQVFLGLPSINTVYWTLTYEVQFYVVVVICVMAAQRRGSLVYLVPFAIALTFGTHLVKSPVRGLFVDNWHCFFLGALAYWAYQRKEALIGFAILGSAVILFNPSPFNLISTATAFGLMIARKTGHIRYSPKPLLFLGAISYSLYLTHNPIMGASFFLTKKLALSQWAELLIAVAACIAVSSAFLVADRASDNGAGQENKDGQA
jgi:peptidoglycan/LPS O-acetylase OafA/YrhL